MMIMRLAGAAILGLCFSLAFAPFYYWPVGLLSICGLFYLLLTTPKPALLAWCFGVGKYGLGASWVYVSIHVYGQAPPLLAGALVTLFVCGMALFCLPIGWLVGRLRQTQLSDGWLLVGIVGAWVGMDWLLTWFLTGFPWLFIGFGFVEHFMGGWAPVLGVLGLSALLVTTCALVVFLVVSKPAQVKVIAPVFGFVAVVWGAGFGLDQVQWTEPVANKQVALVQGNLDQAVKWNADQRIPNWRTHIQLTQPHWEADLVVWPEAAITMFAHQAGPLIEELDAQARASDTAMVVGVPGANVLPDGSYDFLNLGLGLGLANGRFAKHHLVPFGDYVPLQEILRGLIQFFDLPMSNAKPGAALQPNIDLGFTKTALAICYEIAYGDSMRRRALDAGLLMTISNDTWFGASIGPHQHMQIAQMRALENARWLVRATNNGVTGIVNPQGELTAVLPQFEAQTLVGDIQIMQGRTPYSKLGDWPLLIGLIAWLVWVVRQLVLNRTSATNASS